MSKAELLKYMSGNELCVISTVNKSSSPESAIVGFSHDEDLNIYIGTSNKSRKYANLTENHKVAVVIGNKNAEIQYEGHAFVIDDSDYRSLVEQRHISKLPGAAEYRENPDQVYVKINPIWIRFLQHGANSGIEEFTEFNI